MPAGAMARDRRHVDDRARSCRDHPRADVGGQTEGALQVDADDFVEEFFADIAERWIKRRHTRVVDQHIDMPELVVRALGEHVGVGPTGRVVAHRERATSERSHLVGNGVAVIDLAARDHDVGTAGRKGENHFSTETATSAGDDGNFAREIESFGLKRHRSNVGQAVLRCGGAIPGVVTVTERVAGSRRSRQPPSWTHRWCSAQRGTRFARSVGPPLVQ